MNYIITGKEELPREGDTYEFQGYQHGDTGVSFIWVDMPPGGSVRLHKHPYKEIFIIQEGTATFTVGSETLAAQAGQIIIVLTDQPHKFVNSGEGRLKQVDIHLNKQTITHWLED